MLSYVVWAVGRGDNSAAAQTDAARVRHTPSDATSSHPSSQRHGHRLALSRRRHRGCWRPRPFSSPVRYQRRPFSFTQFGLHHRLARAGHLAGWRPQCFAVGRPPRPIRRYSAIFSSTSALRRSRIPLRTQRRARRDVIPPSIAVTAGSRIRLQPQSPVREPDANR